MCTWNLRMQHYLEVVSLQVELVNVRLYWVRVGPIRQCLVAL